MLHHRKWLKGGGETHVIQFEQAFDGLVVARVDQGSFDGEFGLFDGFGCLDHLAEQVVFE